MTHWSRFVIFKTMKRNLFLLSVISILLIGAQFCFAQEEEAQGIVLLREAKEYGRTLVAVEANLSGNILDVKIIAKMYAKRPNIYNALFVGPKVGRMSPDSRQTLRPEADDEELIFKTTDEGGFLRTSKRTKEKKIKGALTKQSVQFKIPAKKIVPNKKYQLWIDVESMQNPGQYERFKFDLENLSEYLSE